MCLFCDELRRVLRARKAQEPNREPLVRWDMIDYGNWGETIFDSVERRETRPSQATEIPAPPDLNSLIHAGLPPVLYDFPVVRTPLLGRS